MNHQAAAPGSAANSPTKVVESDDKTSLAQIVPGARFFSGDDIVFSTVSFDPADCAAGQLVVYRVGHDDPNRVIAAAMARGAAGILTEQLLPCPLPQCIVGDCDAALARICRERLGRPDRRLLMIGVAGRAGKTTTALQIASLLRGCGYRVAYQTDLGQCDGVVQTTSQLPPPIHAELVERVEEAVEAGSQVAVIELSDDALRRGGYDAVDFDLLIVAGGGSRDADYGPSVIQCALDVASPEAVVISAADDRQTTQWVREHDLRQVTFSVRKQADVTAKLIEQSEGVSTLLLTYGELSAVMETRLCGAANAENHLAAASVGLLLGEPLARIGEQLGRLREIPGRGQRFAQFKCPTVVIEAGGSPDRVAAVLRTQRSMTGSGQLWCVLALDAGAGPEYQARYGALLERFADRTVITAQPTSKPHFLSAAHRFLDGVQACAAVRLIADRRRAMEWTIAEAGAADTILVITGPVPGSAHDQRSELEKLGDWIKASWENREQPRPALKVFR